MNDNTTVTSGIIRMLVRITGITLILAGLVFVWLYRDFQEFREEPLKISSQDYVLHVKPGMSLQAIAQTLSEDGLLDKTVYLITLGRFLKLDSSIKAGEYRIPPGIGPEPLLRLLSEGKVIQHSLTLIEGETFRELMRRVNSEPALTHTLAGLSSEEIMTELGYPGINPEGRFLPETYQFPRGSADRDFLKRAFVAMERLLNTEWSGRDDDLPLQTPYEALILASIVEKETGKNEERPKIAGVFIRRLKQGMRLQTDPTVIYGLGDSFDGDIRYRDLRTDTPYNTYTRNGLTPTPIAMPGKDAILAVLHPADGKALYFVSKGDGSHYFSSTLKEHNQAVNRYQKKKQ